MSIIAQITDLHIDNAIAELKLIDSRAHVLAVLDALQAQNITQLIVSGDIAETRSGTEWFLEQIRQRGFDAQIMLGNHDQPEVFVEKGVFGGPQAYYARSIAGTPVLFLDSGSYSVDAAQLAWLAGQIAQIRQDFLLFIHHPVLDCGETLMDKNYPLKNRAEVLEILASTPHKISLFCGHYHTEALIIQGNVTQYVTPSTFYQLKKYAGQLETESDAIGYRILSIENGKIETEVKYLSQHTSGPQPFSHEARMARANEIAAKFRAKFDVLAIGLYGSLARGTDGPYSDIEMFCVVRGKEVDTSYEWSEGGWKAEVNVQSADVLLEWAAGLDEFWPLTHGSCINVLPLYDPQHFFERLKKPVYAHPAEAFDELVSGVIVGELYEFLGKIRNARALAKTENLAALAVEMAQYGAYLIGLANRKLYTSSATMFAESMVLTDKPSGYVKLCEMVASGGLDDPAGIARAADEFWEGIEAWASEKSIPIHQKLDDLLGNV